jgi:hypothetical protein
MGSTIHNARVALNQAYAPLRDRILAHYANLALVGRGPVYCTTRRGLDEWNVPRRLGQWHTWTGGHSDRVLKVAPELAPTVRAIEALLRRRDPEHIKEQYTKEHPTPFRRGDNFRRRNPKKQVNPGEWPPRYKNHSYW